MNDPKRILVFQTAFLGDVILTLPMIRVLHSHYPNAVIDVVVTPRAAEFLSHNPDIAEVIPYDKRGTQKGIRGMISLSVGLRKKQYDIAVVPHRSMRSSLIIGMTGIPMRITFSNTTGRILYHRTVKYVGSIHEVERNLSLLTPLGVHTSEKILPSLYPSAADRQAVSRRMLEREIMPDAVTIAIAPGSVWNTKRWPLQHFADLAQLLTQQLYDVMIIGGNEDKELGRGIAESVRSKRVHDLTGTLTLLQSAELIRRCAVLVTNDSAPLHMGVAMRTPVVAIFGATVPEFGFGPYGENDVVVETNGLECRPCAIHGGDHCPIGTFVCMKNIAAETVAVRVVERASARSRGG